MKKNYQTAPAAASIDELELPEAVTLAITDLAGAVKEGLLALAVGAGLQVMQVMQVMQLMMEEDVTRPAGVKGRHDSGRMAKRHGTEAGPVTLGGRRRWRPGPLPRRSRRCPGVSWPGPRGRWARCGCRPVRG